MMTMLLAAMVVGCAPQERTDSGPYGVWSTRAGETITIKRDGTYAYCDGPSCMSGQIELVGASGVHLKEFFVREETKRLLLRSGYTDLLQYMQSPPPTDFDFTEGAMTDSQGKRYCDGKPCVAIGAMEGDVVAFAKVKGF
jgi:hypothetical protein